jgi:hypothetical protein
LLQIFPAQNKVFEQEIKLGSCFLFIFETGKDYFVAVNNGKYDKQ